MTPTVGSLEVLYDPAGWAHQQWLDHYHIDPLWPSRLINRLLMRRAMMANVTSEDCTCERAEWLFKHWCDLPALAYIAGARVARDSLGSVNSLTCLQLNAAQFISLPVSLPDAGIVDCASLASEAHVDAHALVAASGAYCLALAMQGLAVGWIDRIRMRLPPIAGDLPLEGLRLKQPLLMAEQRAFFRLMKFSASFHYAQNH